MRPDHMMVFYDVADRHGCWIGLREPNELSGRWVGRPGGTPKPESCKAKTADNAGFHWSGLVVDPMLRPEAFTPGSLPDARDAWRRFAPGSLPPGYTRAETGEERGLVKLRGSFLFADFDLMALLRAGPDGELLPTDQTEQRRIFDAVKPALNVGLGVPMIQHGAEMMWADGVGARAFEWVLWFGPGRRFRRDPSSMPGPHRRGGGH